MWDLIVSVPDHCLSFYFTAKETIPCIFYPALVIRDLKYQISHYL